MSRGKARAALPWLAVAAFWLSLLGPLSHPGFVTQSHDGALYLLRAVQLDQLVGQGVWWPRWSPGMVFGYGYPLFNFSPNLSLYPVVLLHRLGLAMLPAWNAALALGLLASGWAMYLWARRVWGTWGGLVAAVAYMLAPYQLYDVYWRGNIGESLTLPMLPLAMWGALRLSQQPSKRSITIGALPYAAVLLMHAPAGLMLSLMLGLYGLALIAAAGAADRRKVLAGLAGLAALGAGLAAFFLIPAIAEKNLVQLWRGVTGISDYRYHFLSLAELFGPPPAGDPALINPSPPRSLGWVASLLALVGLLMAAWRMPRLDRNHRAHVLWAVVTLAFVVLMVSSASAPIWSHISLLAFIQFPMRFLGMGSLAAALLAGMGVSLLCDQRWLGFVIKVLPSLSRSQPSESVPSPQVCAARKPASPKGRGAIPLPLSGGIGLRSIPTLPERDARWGDALKSRSPDNQNADAQALAPLIAGACAALIGLGSLPWLYPPLVAMPADPGQAYYTQYEEGSKLIGMTTFGEYLPAAVAEFPTTSPFAPDLRQGNPINRWEASGAQVSSSRDDGLRAEIELSAPSPMTVTYQSFYYPGWQARLDGRPVPIRVSPPLGLMSIDAPAGNHTISIAFGETPLRAGAWAISLIAAAAAVALAWSPVKRTKDVIATSPSSHTIHSTARMGWVLAAAGLALFAIKAGVVDHIDTPLRWTRLHDGQLAGVPVPSDAVIGGRARLLGYNVSASRAQAGDRLYADLYWTRLDKPFDMDTTLRLVDPAGLQWSAENDTDFILSGFNRPPPSREWRPGAYAHDRRTLQVAPGTPPGQYALVVVPFNPDTLQPLPVSAGQAAPGNYPGLVVGHIQVTPPTRPTSPQELGLDVTAHLPLGSDLAVVGYGQDRSEAGPGQTMLLSVGWQALHKPAWDARVRLDLVGPDGQPALRQEVAPAASWPTSAWSAGELVRSRFLVHIPRQARSGEHTWRITLLDPSGSPQGQTSLGVLQINAPERQMSSPPIARSIGARLGEWALLAGVNAPEPAAAGQALPVGLVWQAAGETDRDWQVFVHLLDAAGNLAAQSDQAPAAGARPTSGWLPGEFIQDTHTLDLRPDLPPGDYVLTAGLYDPESGQRLAGPGGDVIQLGSIHVRAGGTP